MPAASCCKMRVEHVAQELAAAIGAEDLEGCAMPLHECPCLKQFVGSQCLVLHVHQVSDCEACRIVRECSKITAPLACGNGCRAPDIGMYMYLISEVLGWQADADFRGS